MKSTAETLKNLIDCLCTAEKPLNAAATGGGAKSNFWLQICSEKTGVNIFRADCHEPATKGAAITTKHF
jgi:sugar (pentulose or hexulose) kinase